MSDSVLHWLKTLNNLLKFAGIKSQTPPEQLLNFLHADLSQIKDFLPIVSSLRTRGLEKRHFQEMSKILGINIDPSVLTLLDIKK